MVIRNTAIAEGTDGRGSPVAPVAHPSVRQSPQETQWRHGHGGGAAIVLATAALVGALAVIASGAQLLPPGADFGSGGLGSWFEVARYALLAGAEFARLQAFALVHPSRAFEALLAFGRSQGAAALGLDFVFMVAYATLISRPLAWAFARAAGWRNVDEPIPWASWLGLALPVMLVGDVTQDVLGLIALWIGPGWLGTTELWLGSLGSLAKVAGLVGCWLLFFWGWLGPRKLVME
jgi:hypothetical protein